MENKYKPEDMPRISPKQIVAVKVKYGDATEASLELLGRLKNGDAAAFETMYLQFVKPLFEFVNTLLHDEEEARNVVQDTFMYIWEKYPVIDFSRGVKGILFTYSKSRAIDYFRKRKRGEVYSALPHTGSALEHAHDEVVIGNELALLIDLAIDSMPPQRRRIFEMQRLGGKSNREIAKELGISDATVSVHLREARKDLEKILRLIIFFLLR